MANQIVERVPLTINPNQNSLEWSAKLCGCCEDSAVGCLTCCCPCIIGCNITKAMDEHCCVANCMDFGYWPLRLKLRMYLGIKGNICQDCCIVYCCHCCAICQIARELKNHGQM